MATPWDVPPTPQELNAAGWDSPPTPEEMRAVAPAPMAESAARGGMQGLTLGFGDELSAGLAAALPFLDREAARGETIWERYKNARDFYRGLNSSAEKANPGTYLAGQVAGGVVPSLVAPAASVATGPKALLIAAGQGAAAGAGYSEADDLKGLARDTAVGGALGTAGYGAGKVLSAGYGAARRKAVDLASRARGKAGAQAAEEAAKALKTETSRLGGYAQDTNREIEWIIRLLDEEKSGTISAANRTALEAFRQSPAYAALVNKSAERVLKQAPTSAGRTAAQEATVAAMQQAQPQAVAARTAELLTPQVKADTRSFLKSYAEPVVWGGLGIGAGKALGLDPDTQAALGVVAGAIGGRTRAGKALLTRLNRPAHQLAFANALQSAANKTEPMTRALVQRGLPAAMAAAMATREEP